MSEADLTVHDATHQKLLGEDFMPDLLDLRHLSVDEVLGFGISVLMALMMLSLALWFACSIVQNIAKMGRQVHRQSYEALWRENERLRDSLVEARQENDYLRKLYRNDLPPRGRKAADQTPRDRRRDELRPSGLYEGLRPLKLFAP